MPFLLQATVDDHVLTVILNTEKEVFAKAVEWHVVGRFTNINIDDGVKSYSLDEFSSLMALRDIHAEDKTDKSDIGSSRLLQAGARSVSQAPTPTDDALVGDRQTLPAIVEVKD